MNNVSIVGRLVAKPELKETTGGVKFTSFIVACDRPFLNKDGNREADFIPVVVWRGAAEFVCRNFEKSDYISVSGTVRTSLRTREDGGSYRTVEIHADRCDFAGYRKQKA